MNANLEFVSYKQNLDLWCEYCGLNTGTSQPQADRDSFNRLFNRVARRGWERRWWPDLMNLEERHYRDSWIAQAYASGSEVYDAATDKYWSASQATTAADVPGTSSKWTEMFTADTYIGYNQAGMTPLGGVKAVYSANFRTSSAYELAFELDDRGVRLTDAAVPRSAWVHFRTRCPVWRGPDFSGSTGYAAGVTRYFGSDADGFDGDFWTTLAATGQGESPITMPAKWQRLALPTYLSDFTVQCAKLGFLEGDGQLEKALAADGKAWEWLFDEEDRLQSQGGNSRKVRVKNI